MKVRELIKQHSGMAGIEVHHGNMEIWNDSGRDHEIDCMDMDVMGYDVLSPQEYHDRFLRGTSWEASCFDGDTLIIYVEGN